MIHAQPANVPSYDRPSVQARPVTVWRITDRFAARDLDALVDA